MLVYKETRYPARIHARICMGAREQRRDIDINRGQGRAGACFVIRAPLTSKVVNLCENVARIDDGRFETSYLWNFSRGLATFFIHHPLYPTRDITRWRHPPRGVLTCRATYETSNYAKTRSDTKRRVHTPGENRDDSSICIRPTEHFFVSPNRDKCPISDKLAPSEGLLGWCLSHPIARYLRAVSLLSQQF